MEYQLNNFILLIQTYHKNKKYNKSFISLNDYIHKNLIDLTEKQKIQIYFLYTICCYYIGQYDLGKKCCEFVLLHRQTTPEYQKYTIDNYLFYLDRSPPPPPSSSSSSSSPSSSILKDEEKVEFVEVQLNIVSFNPLTISNQHVVKNIIP